MGDRRQGWFCCGLVLAVLWAGPSRAADPQDAIGPQDPAKGGQTTIVETYPSRASQANTARPTPEDLGDGYAAPGIPPPVPQDDPTAESEEPDGLEPSPKAGQRPPVEDGYPDQAGEPPVVNDGTVDLTEPAAPEDGTDPSVVDTRDADDIALFENPPAGYDPLLFQIEDLDPYRDNRTTRRLFRQEPYDPVGIKVGNFVLFPELEIGGSYYTNVFHAPRGQADVALDAV